MSDLLSSVPKILSGIMTFTMKDTDDQPEMKFISRKALVVAPYVCVDGLDVLYPCIPGSMGVKIGRIKSEEHIPWFLGILAGQTTQALALAYQNENPGENIIIAQKFLFILNNLFVSKDDLGSPNDYASFAYKSESWMRGYISAVALAVFRHKSNGSLTEEVASKVEKSQFFSAAKDIMPFRSMAKGGELSSGTVITNMDKHPSFAKNPALVRIGDVQNTKGNPDSQDFKDRAAKRESSLEYITRLESAYSVMSRIVHRWLSANGISPVQNVPTEDAPLSQLFKYTRPFIDRMKSHEPFREISIFMSNADFALESITQHRSMVGSGMMVGSGRDTQWSGPDADLMRNALGLGSTTMFYRMEVSKSIRKLLVTQIKVLENNISKEEYRQVGLLLAYIILSLYVSFLRPYRRGVVGAEAAKPKPANFVEDKVINALMTEVLEKAVSSKGKFPIPPDVNGSFKLMERIVKNLTKLKV